jgi:hypoxanthine phosphoribosyltransferase
MASTEVVENDRVPKEFIVNIEKVLFTESQIQQRVRCLAQQISQDFAGKELIVCGLLKGAFLFVADLSRYLTVRNKIDFIVASSYGDGTTSSGSVKLKKDIDIDPKGRHVIIVEDLIDTGTTLAWVKQHFISKEVASLKICCLLNKVERRVCNVPVDYCGWECPDEFVVGYGMDYAEDYRTLPFVGVLKRDAYSNI